jgi:hypothetical protein
MPNQIQVSTTTGSTIYALVRNAASLIWNGSGFETYETANYANYPLSMTEQGSHSGYYAGPFPIVIPGEYEIVMKAQSGGSPAETDQSAGNQTVVWDGTQFGLVGLENGGIAYIGPSLS